LYYLPTPLIFPIPEKFANGTNDLNILLIIEENEVLLVGSPQFNELLILNYGPNLIRPAPPEEYTENYDRFFYAGFGFLSGLISPKEFDLQMRPLKFLKIKGLGRFMVVFERSNTSKILTVNSNRDIEGSDILENSMADRNLDVTSYDDLTTNKNGHLVGFLYDENKWEVFDGE
jgi:hypothetical protein